MRRSRAAFRALEALYYDVRKYGAPQIQWSIRHAPDGDLRGAVQRLWDTTTDGRPMLWLLDACGRRGDVVEMQHAARDALKLYRPWVGRPADDGYKARWEHVVMCAFRAMMPVAPLLPCEAHGETRV